MLPLSAFQKFISDNQLFSPEQEVLLAVSGGRDSVLMAHLFAAAGYRFAIAHCNFQLRGPESERDARFVQDLAAQLGVSCHVKTFDTKQHASRQGISTQMAARELRYTWFEELRQARGATRIALAQHQTDLVETVLINQLRGTGISGLHGILPLNGNLIRPLLFMTAAGIASAVEAAGIRWVEDSSNGGTDYQRNKLRHEVLPVLRQLNPSLEQTFTANAARLAHAERLLTLTVRRLQDSIIRKNDVVKIPIALVSALDPQPLLLFELLRPFAFNEEAVNGIIAGLDGPSGRLFYSATHRLVKDRDYLLIDPRSAPAGDTWPLTPDHAEIKTDDWIFTQREGETGQPPKDPQVAWTDGGKLVYPLSLRFWKQGDRFRPLGMTGFKKVSDYFINQKVSIAAKERVPLLINGNGEVIWIAGMRLDDRYKVNPDTKKVVIFEFKINPVGK